MASFEAFGGLTPRMEKFNAVVILSLRAFDSVQRGGRGRKESKESLAVKS